MSAFAGLLRKEGLHILRDRRTLLVVIFMPILQVVLFGYAIRTDISDIRLAIVDPSPDASTLELRNRFSATDAFRIVSVLPNVAPLDGLFASGAIQEAVVLEGDFANRLSRGLIPFRSRLVNITNRPGYDNQPAFDGSAILYTSIRSGQADIWRFENGKHTQNLFVPGLIAFVLTVISALMTAISLTREKETGTMEILLVSPLRPFEIIIGKVLAYLVIGFVSVLFVVAEARLIFNVPLRGSLLLLLGEGLLYILTSLSLGILISSRTSSQRVAMIGALAGTMLPTILLSGFIFPLESMPWPLRAIANVIPAKWFVMIARGIMLKGIGLEYLWPQTLVLLGMTVVLVAAATRSFRIRLA